MLYAAAAAKSLQSCPTLCDPIEGSPPGSAVPGILQARILEWVAIAFSDTTSKEISTLLPFPVRQGGEEGRGEQGPGRGGGELKPIRS